MATSDDAKPYWEMTTEELAAATADFEREFAFEDTKLLSAKKRAQLERAKRKPGRPKIGEGSQAVSVTIERGLLKMVDAVADSLGMTRAQLIKTALVALLAGGGLY